MSDDKRGLAILWGLGALLGLIALARRKPTPPEVSYGAEVALMILDAETGEPVPQSSPATVTEGGQYLATATVTNRSTRVGQPVAAVLTVKFYGFAGGIPSIPITQPAQTFNFAAGQAAPVNTTFTVPLDTGGQAGEIGVWVESPTGVELARAYEPLTILSAAIVYGAGVTIRVA